MAEYKPREPDDHEYTGTGTTRAADDGLQQESAFSGGEVDPAISTGARATSQPAQSDEVIINRSGSGGSGGPVEDEPGMVGSSSSSMAELLTGEDDLEPPSG
ncbi:MAG: hypothetical protein M3N29_03515 [Chloroflexota bacterium]|nr:hypothetical protein [Chloroflexota bacterium]